MVNTSLCNSIYGSRKRYSPEKRNGLKPIIASVRKKLYAEFGGVDHEKMTFTGFEFDNDDSVIARLESENQTEIQKIGWSAAIRVALVNCMMHDYYVMFEKEYRE